jgi:hypothetical protein
MGSVGIGMFGFRAFRSRLEIKPHRELGLPGRGHETGRAKGRVGGAQDSVAELLRDRTGDGIAECATRTLFTDSPRLAGHITCDRRKAAILEKH